MRDEWLAAIAAHIDLVERNWDAAIALDPVILNVARQLAAVLSDDPADLLAWHLLGRFHMYRDGALYQAGNGGWEADNAAMSDAFARCLLAGMDVPREVLGSALRQAAAMTGAPDSARLAQRLASALPIGSPLRAVFLAFLAEELVASFGRTGDAASLEAAIAVARDATEEAANDEPRLPAMHALLGTLLTGRFEQSGDSDALDAAVESLQRALDTVAADDPNRARYLSTYGSVLRTRFERTGDPADLDAAVSACERAVATADDATRPSRLPPLANVLVRRFEEHGRTADLEAAITAYQQAADALAAGSPERPNCLLGLGTALRRWYELTARPGDLDEAITVARQTVTEILVGHPDRPSALGNLAGILMLRATALGRPQDMDEAVAAGRHAVEAAPAGHRVRGLFLTNLSAALSTRYEHRGDAGDLDEAIALAREAVTITSTGDVNRHRFLLNLSDTLQDRFGETDDPADADEAVATARQALAELPEGHSNRVNALLIYGAALRERSEVPGYATDLDDAITLIRQVIATLPAGPTRTGPSSSLANMLRQRFRRDGDQADLDEAIEIFRGAADESDEGADDGGSALFQLGHTLLVRYEQLADFDDLTGAAAALRQALGAPVTDPDDPALYCSELSDALQLLYERIGQPADLAEAIALARQSVETTPVGHSALPGYQLTLGKALKAQARADQAPGAGPERITRSELVTMLRGLTHIDSTDDLSVVLVPEGLEAATRLAGLLAEDASPDVDSYAALGRFFWLRYLALPETDGDGDDDPEYAALTAAISAYLPVFRAGRTIPSRLAVAVAREAAEEAIVDLYERLWLAPDAALLTGAVALWRRILDVVPADHREHAGYTGVLGAALFMRYIVAGDRADLDEGVAALRTAIAGVPDDYDLLPSFRAFLSDALGSSAAASGDTGALDQAIALSRQAVTEERGEDREHARAQLGWMRVARYQQVGDPADLAEGTALLAEAIGALPPDASILWEHLMRLSEARRLQFAATGDPALLAAAADAGQRAVDCCPDGHPEQVACWGALGAALLSRAAYLGDDDDLDAAIDLFARAAERAPAGGLVRALCEVNLGQSLLARCSRVGRPADLDAAIESLAHALTVLPASGVTGAAATGALGQALMTRFFQAGGLGDLDAAISRSRDAVASVPPAHPDQARYLWDCALGLQHRYGRTGDLRDLDEAIKAARQALTAAPADPAQVALYQMTLSAALRTRCWAAASQPGPETDTEADGARADAAVTDDGAQGTDLDAVAARVASDLTESVALIRQAVAAIPPGHQLGPVTQAELGATLLLRFTLMEDTADLDAAVTALRQTIAATEGQPFHAENLHALAVALEAASKETGRPEYREEAIARYRAAVHSPLAPAAMRIRAARDGADLVADFDPAIAADLLEEAIRLLPEAVSRQLGRADQQHAVGEFTFLASLAAEQALFAGGAEAASRALGLLEQGRAVLQGQALDIRRDLLDLQAAHPELAVRFTRLREQMEAADGRDGASVQAGHSALDGLAAMTRAIRLTEASGPGPIDGTPLTSDRFRAGTQFAALLGQIRALEGFESFLLPPSPAELTRQAVDGPIVTFNVGRSRSDALVVAAEAVTAVPLPALTLTDLLEQAEAWDQSLDLILHHVLDLNARLAAEDTLNRVLEWLWDVAAEPVLSHLGYRRMPEPGQAWPRVWWAPGGLLGRIPVHAAGYHRLPGAAATVLDRVVSTYTPTVRALVYARERARPAPPARALIVAMPTTPGLQRLPGVTAEATALSELLPSPTVLIEAANGAVTERTPTRDAVTSQLAQAGIVHFTCHAASDPGDPSRSRVFLHDWAEHPFTVATLIPVRLRRAQLAFLSACETARSDSPDLLDEGIHLASAFQLAGFPHVIGTLWPIYDHIAAEVATDFYTRLQTGPRTLDVSASAQALHDTIREVRGRPTGRWYPSTWAAYMHAGS